VLAHLRSFLHQVVEGVELADLLVDAHDGHQCGTGWRAGRGTGFGFGRSEGQQQALLFRLQCCGDQQVFETSDIRGFLVFRVKQRQQDDCWLLSGQAVRLIAADDYDLAGVEIEGVRGTSISTLPERQCRLISPAT
jgi:hypothetical protein